ncbi:MAG: PP0621 family protein [Sulfurospirillum sp.]
MIFKLLIFGLVVFIVYTLFFKSSRGKVRQEKKRDKKKIDSDTMVECANCSVFVSESEAIIKDGRFYCSKECAGVK